MTTSPLVSTPVAKPKSKKKSATTKPKKTKKSVEPKGSKFDVLSSQIMAMSEDEFNNLQQKPFERPLAEATLKKYNKHASAFVSFCTKYNMDPNGLSVLKYLITCKELGATGANIKQYHSAIMNYFTTTLKKNLKYMEGYATVIALLKDMNKKQYNSDVVQAGVFSREDLIKIWKYMATIPKTPRMVQILAIWTWQLFTLFRCDDLTQMMWENMEIDEANKTIEIYLGKSKTGPADATITANNDDISMSAWHIIQDFFKLIPIEERKGRVWRQWIAKKNVGGYFSTKQPIGKNQFSILLRELFRECLSVLPEQIQWEEANQKRKEGCRDAGERFGVNRFTSHSTRRTMTTIAAASDSISSTELQRLGRWSNALTMERYKDNNSLVRINTQKKLGAIFTVDVGNLHAGTAAAVTAVTSDPTKALAELGLVFNNCTVSITINNTAPQ